MQIEINTRHFNLGEEQVETIEATFEKLEKFSPRPVQELKMTINHESGRFYADAVLHLKSHEFRAKGEGVEPEYAVNELEESFRKQLTKYKGKISGKQKGEDGGLGRAMLEDGELLAGDAAPEGFVLNEIDVAGAKISFEQTEKPFLVFRNIENSRVGVIYRRADGALGHMESNND